MSKVKRSELPGLIEPWRQLLLPEWRVVVMDEPPPDEDEDDCFAVSQTSDDYTEIRVHFTDDCLDRARRYVEVTVVHELLHALTRPMRTTMDRVAGDLPRRTWQAIVAEQDHQEEQLVDRLSRVLVEFRCDIGDVGPGTVKGPVA